MSAPTLPEFLQLPLPLLPPPTAPRARVPIDLPPVFAPNVPDVTFITQFGLEFEPFEFPAAAIDSEVIQARKRTWQPNRLKRKRTHGFLK